MNFRRIWTEEEDNKITQLVKKLGHKNWALIAIQLGKQLGQRPRSGKQCRERWHNHLDPVIEKKSWSKEQQDRLFQLHQLHGNRWIVIADSLPGRTDNAIKNYFYSTIRRSLRRMGKFVGSKNSTEQMKKIKPSTLSKIFAAGQQLSVDQEGMGAQQKSLLNYIRDNCENIRDEIVQFTSYKPKRNDKANVQDRAKYEKVIDKMVQINVIYERVKGEEKRRRYQELMFQKDYHKIMVSDDSQQASDEQIVNSQSELELQYNKIINTRTRNKSIIQQKANLVNMPIKKQSNRYKNDGVNSQIKEQLISNSMMPTVIIKSQQNLSEQVDIQSHQMQFQNPQFFIELKDDFLTQQVQQSNLFNNNIRSPGYYFNTPSINTYGFFQSPSTPKPVDNYLSSFQGLGALQSSTIDQFQVSIQKQIESNMTRDENKLKTSFSTIGSPGSAFRFCGL